MVVVGSTSLQRKDSQAIHNAVSTIAQTARVQSGCWEEWKVLNVLHRVSVIRENQRGGARGLNFGRGRMIE